MADEPSNGELARRLDEIVRLLQGLVSRTEYTEYQRYIEHRFAELQHDLEEKRRVHEQDIRDLRAAQSAYDAKDGVNLRQAIYNGVVPGIIFAIGTLVTVLLAFKGGGK